VRRFIPVLTVACGPRVYPGADGAMLARVTLDKRDRIGPANDHEGFFYGEDFLHLCDKNPSPGKNPS
jgi:hypothetical protein